MFVIFNSNVILICFAIRMQILDSSRMRIDGCTLLKITATMSTTELYKMCFMVRIAFTVFSDDRTSTKNYLFGAPARSGELFRALVVIL